MRCTIIYPNSNRPSLYIFALVLMLRTISARLTAVISPSRGARIQPTAVIDTTKSLPVLHSFRGIPVLHSSRGGGRPRMFSPATGCRHVYKHRVFLAVGSNLGDRYANIHASLDLLCRNGKAKVVRTSFLRETAPMYVTDQPAFLNGALVIETDLEPHDLLQEIKRVEAELGRDLAGVIRNGPRPVDLDILIFQSRRNNGNDEWISDPVLTTEDLVVPHPRIAERTFVLEPLLDVAGSDFEIQVDSTLQEICVSHLLRNLHESCADQSPSAVRVLPLPRGRMLYFNETVVMGILNVTPDSFSDGGKWTDSVQKSVDRALEMEREGAKIVDIGGESTRPNADLVPVEEEIRRTIPVIQAIRKESDIAISIDTRNAKVADAAVKAGADIVNDVSGGMFDPDMFDAVAALGVPMVIMHMRGTPKTMQGMNDYDDVVAEVGASLYESSENAAAVGIHRWLQIVDPGIGFAKDVRGNLVLLKNIPKLRELATNLPILIGTSRKGFIGRLTGVDEAEDRDFGSVASWVAALCYGAERQPYAADIVRVHNVEASKHATSIIDAIKNAS